MDKQITVSSFIFLKEIKSKKTGKPYEIFEVGDNEGKLYETFEKNLEVGQVYDVEITPNGEYTPKLKLVKDYPKNKEEKKWDKVVDRKENSINWAGAKRDGVAITVALIKAGLITDKTKIKPCIEHYTKYLYSFFPNGVDKQVKDLSKDVGIKIEPDSTDEPY